MQRSYRSVSVNRDPGEFSFNDIYFDLYNYNSVRITWQPATDSDGDILSYDVFFEDKLVVEKYVIGSDAYQGEVSYYENFEEYLDKEFVIRILANDRSGGIKEISRSFNFRATDIDLGALIVPNNDSFQFKIVTDEPDNKIGYTFTIDQETGYSFSTQSDVYFNLFTSTGESVDSSYRGISGRSLPAGSYYLEINNDYYYYNQDVSGSVDMSFRDSNASDVDLGVLALPYIGSIPFEIEASEPDDMVRYIFTIDQETGYSFSTQSDVYFNLYTSTGGYVDSNYREISGGTLSAGSYYLEVTSNSYYNLDIIGSINVSFLDPNVSDVDLGMLTVPFNDSIPFEIETSEPDNKIGYTFTIDQKTGYSFSTQSNVYFNLYNDAGVYINSSYGEVSGESLQAGSYYLEVVNNSNYDQYINGFINVSFRDFNATDVDLGLLMIPYNDSFSFEIQITLLSIHLVLIRKQTILFWHSMMLYMIYIVLQVTILMEGTEISQENL